MKILIKKDIPGYKAGEIVEEEKGYCIQKTGAGVGTYNTSFLISNGFAEEIKDDIDIEAIRKEFGSFYKRNNYPPIDNVLVPCNLPKKDIDFMIAYRIVKTLIEELNGEWKPTGKNGEAFIWWDFKEGKFIADSNCYYHKTPMPMMTYETALKIIELAEPELEILFNVK